MDGKAKILFSKQELGLMCDAGLFPAKRLITQKLMDLLQMLAVKIKASAFTVENNFPTGTDFKLGKISNVERHRK